MPKSNLLHMYVCGYLCLNLLFEEAASEEESRLLMHSKDLRSALQSKSVSYSCNCGRRKLSHQDHLTWSDWTQPIASHISNHWMKLSKQFTGWMWLSAYCWKRQIASCLCPSHSSPWIILALGDFRHWHTPTVFKTNDLRVFTPNH